MQVLQEKLTFADRDITVASREDARQVAQLYRNVYRNVYPSPELFTEEGMAEFLTFERSHCITYITKRDDDVIAAGTVYLHGRTAFFRGCMVDPIWHGKIGARQFFGHIISESKQALAGMVDYFFAETRTETPKMQAIFEGFGLRPHGTLPFKDIFAAGREAEILHVYYCHEPRLGRLRLTPQAAKIASTVLNQPVPAVRVLVPSPKVIPEQRISRNYLEKSNGEGILRLSLSSGASLEASIWSAPLNSDHVAIHAHNIDDYSALIGQFLKELEDRGIEYAEICVPADAPARQMVLENLGFSPTGFLPAWYAPGEIKRVDCVFYTIHFPSILPEVPDVSLTSQSEFFRPFITPASVDVSHMFPAMRTKGKI